MKLTVLIVSGLLYPVAAFVPRDIPRGSPFTLSAVVSRRQCLEGSLLGAAALLVSTPARADVASGNALPQGAQQFARSVRLKVEVKKVQRRLSTAGEGEIDDKEWENIRSFLRTIFTTADSDMKFVAKGIADEGNRNKAENAIDQIKKYAQVGDIIVTKKDASTLNSTLDKVAEQAGLFFDALTDVPSEL